MTKNIPDDQPRRTQGRRARPTVRSPRSDLAPRDPRLLPEDLLRRHPQAPGPSDEAFYEVLRQLHDFKPSVHWQRVFRVIRALIAEFAPPPPPKRRPCWADVAAASLPLCLLAALQSYRWYGQPFPLIIPQLMRLSGFDNPRPERPIQSDSLEQAFRRTVIENGLELFFPVVLIPDLQVDGDSACLFVSPGYSDLEHWFKAREAVPVLVALLREGPPCPHVAPPLFFRVGPWCGRQAAEFQAAAKALRAAEFLARQAAAKRTTDCPEEDAEPVASRVDARKKRWPRSKPRVCPPKTPPKQRWAARLTGTDLVRRTVTLYEQQCAETAPQRAEQRLLAWQDQQAKRDQQAYEEFMAHGGFEDLSDYQEDLDSYGPEPFFPELNDDPANYQPSEVQGWLQDWIDRQTD